MGVSLGYRSTQKFSYASGSGHCLAIAKTENTTINITVKNAVYTVVNGSGHVRTGILLCNVLTFWQLSNNC